MADKRFTFQYATQQVDNFISAYAHSGSLEMACKYSTIPEWEYYEWVVIADMVGDIKRCACANSINNIVKEDKALESQIDTINAPMLNDGEKGYSNEIYDLYFADKDFEKYCNKIYEIIQRLEQERVKVGLHHIQIIENAGNQKNGWQSSAWFLERVFGRTYDKEIATMQKGTNKAVKPIEVVYVDADTDENKKRLEDMESTVLSQLGMNEDTKA